MKKSKTVLKSYFNTGDKPTETQFANLIDSLVHQDDTSEQIHISAVDTNENGDTIVSLSNNTSITVQKPTEFVGQDNKIRVISLGAVYYNPPVGGGVGGGFGGGRLTEESTPEEPGSINAVVAEQLITILNILDPPITIAEDEIVIFECDLIELIGQD